jgi:sugar/nucleoside kinase (ribokinase family)
MCEVWTMGELLVEIMRPRPGLDFSEPGPFVGPFPSGAPGIFADTVARLGHTCGIISGVGDDDFGRAILARLARDGVNTQRVVVVPEKSTGVAFVTYFADGSRKYLFHWDGTPAVMADAPPAEALPPATYFHLMGCSLMANQRFRQSVLTAVERFAGQGTKIAFDPNIRFELLQSESIEAIVRPVLARASVLMPGERELKLLSGVDDLDGAARAMFGRYPLELIAVKRGRRGCTVLTPEKRADVPAFAIQEVDPTGAGDCFDAGLLCGLLEGRPVEDCARWGAAAGALNAGAFGPMEGRISRETIGQMLGGGAR